MPQSIKLPKRIPYHIAMEMLFTGPLARCRRGASLGFRQSHPPRDQLMDKAWEMAKFWNPAAAVYAAIKEVVREAEGEKFQDTMNKVTKRQLRTVDILYGSEDNLEGFKAFCRKARSGLEGQVSQAESQPLARLDRKTYAVAVLLAGIGVGNVQDAFLKQLSGAYPFHEMQAVRTAIGLIVAGFRRKPPRLRALVIHYSPVLMVRGLFLGVGSMFFYLGLAAMTLADAVALYFALPLIMVVLSER